MKKFTSLAAALVLVLSLAACGSADAVPTAASVSQSASASSAAPESESTPESESAPVSAQSTAESTPASTSTSEAASATATAANNLTGITLSSTGGLLYVGYSASAKVYTTPYEAPAANAAEVTYTSSDESVVTVTPNTSGEAGFTVQGAAPGTATVTVEYQGHTAEYNVTVQKYVAPAQTSTNKNYGTNNTQGSAPAATAPVTQAPAATTPTTPSPTTPAPAPTTPPAESQPNIVYEKPQEGVGYDPTDLIGGNGFDWGAVNAGEGSIVVKGE